MPALRRWLRFAPPAIALWLAASWPIGLALDPARLAKPGEAAYLVADFVILLPLALATWFAARRSFRLGAIFLVATLGALAYDATHFAVRTMQEISSGPARIGITAGLLVLLGAIALGIRAAIRYLTGPSRP